MKSTHVFLLGCLLVSSLRAGEVADEQAATEVGITGEARLLGEVADGTPTPPAPPPELPDFRIDDTTVRQLPDRKVTIHRVEDPDLPPLPPPPEPMSEEELQAWRSSPECQAFVAKAQEHYRKTRWAFVSATVYDHERTQLQWWIPGDRGTNLAPRSFEAWSNIDFLHLCGFHSFEYEGIEYRLLMLVCGIDTVKWRQFLAERDRELQLPESPELPADRLAYIVTEGDAGDAEGVAIMDGLHALYAKEKDRLIAAYESREQARIEREAYLKANPPKPKDLILRYWRGKRTQPQPGGSK